MNRSRTDLIGMGGLFFLAGSAPPTGAALAARLARRRGRGRAGHRRRPPLHAAGLRRAGLDVRAGAVRSVGGQVRHLPAPTARGEASRAARRAARARSRRGRRSSSSQGRTGAKGSGRTPSRRAGPPRRRAPRVPAGAPAADEGRGPSDAHPPVAAARVRYRRRPWPSRRESRPPSRPRSTSASARWSTSSPIPSGRAT